MTTKLEQPTFREGMSQVLDNDPNTTAEAWDDIVRAMNSRKLYSSTGKVDWDWDENAMKMQPEGDITDKNDRIFLTFQKLHSIKTDSKARLHIHWRQDAQGVMSPTFTFRYRVQPNGGLTKDETDWTEVNVTSSTDNEVFSRPIDTDVINQITNLGEIDWSGAAISSEIDVQLTRSDSTPGNIYATTIDIHVCRDQSGSRQEYAK